MSAQLKVFGTEGRKGQLDAADTEREHAEAEYLRVHRRARAAQLLRSVMARHRDATRLRYVDPFRNQVERLGRIVFGDTFEVEIDSELRICSRTLSRPHRSVRVAVRRREGTAGHRRDGWRARRWWPRRTPSRSSSTMRSGSPTPTD